MTPNATATGIATATATASDYSLSLQVFLYLQLLDVLSPQVARISRGLAEASPFVRLLLHLGPLTGLLGCKLVAFTLSAFCVWRQKFRVILYQLLVRRPGDLEHDAHPDALVGSPALDQSEAPPGLLN